jgi:hypothetical protein
LPAAADHAAGVAMKSPRQIKIVLVIAALAHHIPLIGS